ncbi:restriction endonuclease subunit S [Streptobacillus moniliformis]|uniref:restriction endonuclease subunit S n=1 Tax=Streptobacillus moniliformis TaxID=34105 RepID=UPI0007E2EBC6|nr:restriction endonuclease subunit S [Streptobacillus moniliformis]
MNRYEKYSNSELTWSEAIPEHWGVKRIARVFDIRKEKNSPIKTKEILSLSAKHGVSLYSDKKEKGGNKPKEDLTSYNLCYLGDILINCMNVVAGSVGISNYFGAVSPVYYPLVNMNQDENCTRYMEYVFRNYNFQRSLVGLGKGIQMSEADDGRLYTVRMRISWDILKTQLLPIPPINEQEQIANYLDWKINEIDRLIQIEKEKIKELKRLTLNIIAEFVLKGINTLNYKKSNIKWIDNIPSHWNEISIRGCVNIIRGNSSFTKDDLKNQGEYVGLQYGKVYKTEIIDSEFNFYVNDKFYKTSQVVTRNDIIIVSTSETVEDLGHTSFYDRHDIGLIGGEQILLKPLNNINSKFLFYLSKIFRTQLQLCATGIKVYRFKISDLKQLYIPLPPIEEQENIVSNIELKLKQLDERVKNNYNLIKELELLKQSLISEVVTGKIDVRNIVIPEYEKITVLDDETEEFDEMEDIEDGD